MRTITIGSILIAAVALFAVFKFSRAGYESAEYTVVLRDGDFEIRDYPDLLVASTPMASASLQEEGSFMRLFGYISGDNEASQNIAMTTPVFTTRNGDERRMSFVVPREVARQGAPQATNPDVVVQMMPGGRFAVYRYSGSWELGRFQEAEKKLTAWMEMQGLSPASEALIAGYDPPFWPTVLRRNETLIRVRAE